MPPLGTLRDVLDTEGRGALESVSVLSGALATDAPQIMSNIEQATGNVARITSSENADSIQRTISNVEMVSKDARQITEDTASVTSGVMKVASTNNIARIDAILTRLDSAAIELEKTMQTASRATERMEQTISDENIQAIDNILVEMQSLQKDVGAIVSSTSIRHLGKPAQYQRGRRGPDEQPVATP